MLKKALYTTRTIDPLLTTYLANVLSAGGASTVPSAARQAQLNTLVFGPLRRAGAIPQIARLFLLAAENSAQSLICPLTGGSATTSGSPPFTANQGFAGNGSTAFVNLGIAPSGLPAIVTDNNIFIGQYTHVVAAADPVVSGAIDGGPRYSYLLGPYTDNKIYPRLGDPSAAGTATAGGPGFYFGGKSSSTTAALSRNGTSLGTATIASGARATTNFFTLGNNNNGSVANAAAAGTRMAAVAIGAYTPGIDVLLWSVLNRYLTTIAPGQF